MNDKHDKLGQFAKKDGGSDSGKDTPAEQQRYSQIEMDKIKAEYKASTNKKIIDYVKDARSNKSSKDKFILAKPTSREIAEIEKLTGIDTSDYTRVLTADTVRHIDNRHGEAGKADKSMSDVEDIARIEYVLANFDCIEVEKPNERFSNSDGTNPNVLVYKKRINGNYFVAQVAPNTDKKQITVLSAYKTKPSAYLEKYD